MKLSSEQIEIKKKIELEGIRNIINNAVSEDITNGDMVKAMFPNCNVEELGLYDYSLIDKETEAIILIAHKWWWNAPYKEK